jgi:putative spermidine/putrescine transport system ATP-binding protein
MQIELRAIQRASGTTTILVTHDQGEAMALSDRIVVMNKGRVEQIAAPHDAYERPATAFVAQFLGKTNVLTGAADGESLRIGDGAWPQVDATRGACRATVRPERITFCDAQAASLGGQVKTRIFQGHHWLYQIDTAAGVVTVIRHNDGQPVPTEGETVRLTWAAGDMTVQLR